MVEITILFTILATRSLKEKASFFWRVVIEKSNRSCIFCSNLFTFRINYNDPQNGATALYNGNISETSWETANDNTQRWYKYEFDALNRIVSAIDNTTDQRYSLTNVSYDKNGNIQNLARNGHRDANVTSFGVMDNLQYTYANNNTSNQLIKVQELTGGSTVAGFKDGANTTTEYIYDVNGNMKINANKGITNIDYNHLNLPTQVTVNGQNIDYVYDATGTKLKKTIGSVSTEYAGNYVYKKTGSGASELEFFNHAEGYVTLNGNGGYDYIYQYRDHLNNVRLSYSDNVVKNGIIEQNEIIEESNYYPFGMLQKGYNSNVSSNGNSTAQKFKYNGIEYEDNTGLYEMDVRSYDPTIARFTSIDPVTHYSMSTYTAFDNNPIFWADPSGADSWTYIGGGNYRNNQTNEETDDWQRAINETQSHFGEGSDDDKRVDTKTGKTTITKTNDSEDRLFVDGKFVKTAEQGSFEKELIENGTEFTYRSQPKAVGMGVTDAALTYFSGEAIFVALSRLGKAIWGVKAAARTKQVIATIEKVSPFDLEMTQYITRSKSQFLELVEQISKNGITEPIEYTIKDGVKYIQNGHHRAYIAKRLGIKNVPVKEIPYKAGMEIVQPGKNPGYLKHIKW